MDPTTAPVTIPPTTVPAPTATPPTPATPTPTDAAPAPTTDSSFCCQQIDYAGVGCTTVSWCNQQQANCEGDCEGVWINTSATSAPTSSPITTSPTAALPTPATPSPTDAAPAPTTNGPFCCEQTDYAGVGCTTVSWCNQQQANCEGDCEGVWINTSGTSTPPGPSTTAPTFSPTPTTTITSAPFALGPTTTDSFCCEQIEYAGVGCTTVSWCNQQQANCEGACEGTWIPTD